MRTTRLRKCAVLCSKRKHLFISALHSKIEQCVICEATIEITLCIIFPLFSYCSICVLIDDLGMPVSLASE